MSTAARTSANAAFRKVSPLVGDRTGAPGRAAGRLGRSLPRPVNGELSPPNAARNVATCVRFVRQLYKVLTEPVQFPCRRVQGPAPPVRVNNGRRERADMGLDRDRRGRGRRAVN